MELRDAAVAQGGRSGERVREDENISGRGSGAPAQRGGKPWTACRRYNSYDGQHHERLNHGESAPVTPEHARPASVSGGKTD